MKYYCSGCSYETNKKSNIIRHINKLKKCKENCKLLNQQDVNMIKLENKINNLETKISVVNNINQQINNNNNNQINNNITITSYKSPDLKDFDKYFLKAIQKIYMSVPTIIEYVHFNDEYPQNHNICIKNYRTKIANVYNGKEWQIINEEELLEELLSNYEKKLEDWSIDDIEKMKYIETYKEVKNRPNSSDDQIKDQIKQLIYNKRNIFKKERTLGLLQD